MTPSKFDHFLVILAHFAIVLVLIVLLGLLSKCAGEPELTDINGNTNTNTLYQEGEV